MRSARERAGFATQRQFASEIGVPPAYVCRWEKPDGSVQQDRQGQVLDALQQGAPRVAPTPPTPNEIRALRERRGWSVLEFARHMGVSAPVARRWQQPDPPRMRPESCQRFRALEQGEQAAPLRPRPFVVELRKLLADGSASQRQLARAVGVSDSTVSTWVRGEAEPNTELKGRIRRHLSARSVQLESDSAAGD